VGGKEGEQVPIFGGGAAGLVVEGATEDIEGPTEGEATTGLAGALEGADDAEGVDGTGGGRRRRGGGRSGDGSSCCCFSSFSCCSCAWFGGACRCRRGRRGRGRGGGRCVLLHSFPSFLPPTITLPLFLFLLLLLRSSLLPLLPSLLPFLLLFLIFQSQLRLPLLLKASQTLVMGQVVVVPPKMKFTQGMRLVATRTVSQQLLSTGKEGGREGGRVRGHSCAVTLDLSPRPSLPPSPFGTYCACSQP